MSFKKVAIVPWNKYVLKSRIPSLLVAQSVAIFLSVGFFSGTREDSNISALTQSGWEAIDELPSACPISSFGFFVARSSDGEVEREFYRSENGKALAARSSSEVPESFTFCEAISYPKLIEEIL